MDKMTEESGDKVLPNKHQADEKTTELIKGLKHAVIEVELHVKGDIKLQRARDFLIEWERKPE
jgi:hypothetical protein